LHQEISSTNETRESIVREFKGFLKIPRGNVALKQGICVVYFVNATGLKNA